VCAHIGWPWTSEAIALAVKHPNVYVGTSAHAPKYWPDELVRFIDSSRGRGKVMWGTDWPLLEHKDSLEQVRALGLKEETMTALLRDNAAQVFGL
jgi:predicted TIM-barrel fold metal-dependent hydrolase